jgi:hypothetical protein
MTGLRAVLAAACIVGHPFPAAGQTLAAAVADPDMTPAAGSAVIDLVATLVGRAQDSVLPPRLFDEDTALRRSAGIAYRFTKLFALDVPEEDWLRVANHEVFGHGARLRERFDGHIGYTIGVPPPYGGGGGSTSFEFDREPTVEEVLAITVGGMEANTVGASRVALRAIRQGEATYRDMLRYLLGRLDAVGYILGTDDDLEEEGHDVSEFIRTLREATDSDLTAADLRRRAIVGLADPMLGYAVYGLVVTYLWRGDSKLTVPAFHVGGIRYLPALRFQLTPFGTEWVIDNTFVRAARATHVAVRIGEAPGARSFGVSVHRDAVWTWRRAQIDADVYAWHQPRVLDDGGVERSTGVAALATASVPVDVKWLRWASVVLQGGYKTRGFIEGEPLGAGVVVRAGLALAR